MGDILCQSSFGFPYRRISNDRKEENDIDDFAMSIVFPGCVEGLHFERNV